MPSLNSIRLAGDLARGLEAGMRRAVGCAGGASTQAARSWLDLAPRHPARKRSACAGIHVALAVRCLRSRPDRGKCGMTGCFAGGLLVRAGCQP